MPASRALEAELLQLLSFEVLLYQTLSDALNKDDIKYWLLTTRYMGRGSSSIAFDFGGLAKALPRSACGSIDGY